MSEIVKLYKYTSVSSALKILSTGKFAFRHPKFFNDPFDGHISDVTNFDGERFKEVFFGEARRLIVDDPTEPVVAAHPSLTELVEQCRMIASKSISDALDNFKESTIESIDSVIEAGIRTFTDPKWLDAMTQMRMLCLSEVNDSVLMWSHYAEDHRGIVIEVNVPIERLEKVNYPKSYPTDMQPADYWAKRQLGTNKWDPDKIFQAQLATKSHWWEYENEWRSIITAKENKADPHFAEIGEIAGVYLGCNCLPIDQTAVVNVVQACHDHVPIYKGEVQKYNYGLKFENYNPVI